MLFPCIILIYVYVQSPETNWIGVMENLDHEGFHIPNKDAFTLLMTMYKLACQVLHAKRGDKGVEMCLCLVIFWVLLTVDMLLQDSFPLHAICGSVWKNSEGQLSFLKYAVSAPPDLFTFSHSVRLLVRVWRYIGVVHVSFCNCC